MKKYIYFKIKSYLFYIFVWIQIRQIRYCMLIYKKCACTMEGRVAVGSSLNWLVIKLSTVYLCPQRLKPTYNRLITPEFGTLWMLCTHIPETTLHTRFVYLYIQWVYMCFVFIFIGELVWSLANFSCIYIETHPIQLRLSIQPLKATTDVSQ